MRSNNMFGGLRNNALQPAQQQPEMSEADLREVARSEKENLKQEVRAAKKEAQAEEEELTQEQKMAQFLEKEHGIPAAQVNAWKHQFGNVYMLAFDDEDIYIYRSIKAVEFNNLMMRLRNVAGLSDDAADTELVRLCLLYPQLDPVAYNAQPAGWLSSLRLAIQRSSRFYSEEEISRITFKL